MKKGGFLIFWIIAVVVLFVASPYYYTCNMRNLCGEEESEIVVETAPKPEEKSWFNINSRTNNSMFQFLNLPMHIKSDSIYRIPETHKGWVDSVYGHMNVDLNDEIVLKGTYVSGLVIDEVKDSTITLFKLTDLKNQLIDGGVNPSKIVIDMSARESLYAKSDTSYDALSMFFREISEEKHVIIDNGIASKTLYANFGSGQFIPDNKLEGYALELVDYLKRFPNKNVSIIGHTDSMGNKDQNYALGQKRADNLRVFFESKGVDPKHIHAESRGEIEPVGSNYTDEGRALNRRIEVEIK